MPAEQRCPAGFNLMGAYLLELELEDIRNPVAMLRQILDLAVVEVVHVVTLLLLVLEVQG